MKEILPLTEELDLHYLLGLLPPLKKEPEFAWLPELFSIIGHTSLINLCKYCGGEVIKIPTLEQLSECMNALQWFYDIFIVKLRDVKEMPKELQELVEVIHRVYYADND
jgi:hypothetical protein